MRVYRCQLYIYILLCLALQVNAQPANTTADVQDDLTVSYTIAVKGKRSNTGMGEAYSGGTKTLFVSNEVVRLRQINMMRMQNIFILPPGNERRKAVIVKESGKDKYKTYLDAAQWKQYNQKYEGATCQLSEEYVTIAGYACHKATIKLTDGRFITAYYTTLLPHTAAAVAEPAFACVPGLVLKYEYRYKKNSITYTATSVSRQPIDQNILRVPSKGYVVK